MGGSVTSTCYKISFSYLFQCFSQAFIDKGVMHVVGNPRNYATANMKNKKLSFFSYRHIISIVNLQWNRNKNKYTITQFNNTLFIGNPTGKTLYLFENLLIQNWSNRSLTIQICSNRNQVDFSLFD